VLGVEDQHRVLDMLRGGMTQAAVADRFGVTKNTIAGLWSRHGEPIKNENIAPTTLDERLDALNAKLDRVLAETRGIGILAPVPPHGPKARRR
jgi:transcriptional regulator with XRE-family HTH domain